MLNTVAVSEPVRSAVLAQIAKSSYKVPSVTTFRVEDLGKAGPLALAGNF